MDAIKTLINWLNYPLLTTKYGTITLWWLLVFFAIVGSSYLFSVVLRRFLRKNVFPRYQIDGGTSAAYERILHYLIMIAGLLTALSLVNINLAVIYGGGAALLVGIGFGLQNIANNFISGVIILFERPIKVGDFIEVEGVLGTVVSISGRSSKIMTNDRVMIIVPNSSFLEKNVINWSYTDATRIHIPVGVKYGTDLALAKQVLLALAAEHPKVQAQPEPYVFCDQFGDSSIDLNLTVWIAEQPAHRKVRSDLMFAIDLAFKKHAIEIPFPQRDLHLKSGQWGASQ